MDKVKIKYNPYLGKINYYFNDKNLEEINENNMLVKRNKEKLQFIFDKNTNNYRGLINEIKEIINTENFILEFEGRKEDFEDLKVEVGENSSIKLEFIDIKDEKKVENVNKFLNEIVSKIDKLNVKSNNIFYEELKSVVKTFREEVLNIYVIAPVNAGKSTLINTFFRKKILKSSSGACTRNNIYIYDEDEKENIEKYYDDKIIDDDEFKELQEEKQEKKIKIVSNLIGIKNNKFKLCIIDTPGVQDDKNRVETDNIFKENLRKKGSMYILLLEPGVRDEHKRDYNEYLENIKEVIKNNKEIKDKIIFVISKFDTLEEDENPKNALEKTKEYIKDKTGIEEPIIISFSGRLYLSNLEEDEKENIIKKFERNKHSKSNENSNVPKYIIEKLEEESSNDNEKKRLMYTGISIIEELINNYISKFYIPEILKHFFKDYKKIFPEELKIKEKNIEENTKDISNLSNKKKELEELILELKNKKNYCENINYKAFDEDELKSIKIKIENEIKEVSEKINEENFENYVNVINSIIDETEKIIKNKHQELLNKIEPIEKELKDLSKKISEKLDCYFYWVPTNKDKYFKDPASIFEKIKSWFGFHDFDIEKIKLMITEVEIENKKIIEKNAYEYNLNIENIRSQMLKIIKKLTKDIEEKVKEIEKKERLINQTVEEKKENEEIYSILNEGIAYIKDILGGN